jgi:CHAD domain-containing protein
MSKERDSPMHIVRDMLVALLDKSVAGLRGRGARDAVIHDVRTELKRARASLRLMRKCIGERAYHRENLVIRDAARQLGAARDATVLLNRFSGLKRAKDSGGEKTFGVRVSRILQKERRESRRRLDGSAMAVTALQGARRRLASIPMPQLERAAVSVGIGRVYKSGRRAFALVQQEATDARLHECRKQAKYLFNQIDIMSRISGSHFARLRKQSHRLAEWLGKDHDLAVLQQKIGQISSAEGLAADSREVRVWADRVRRQRAVLQRKARKLGKRLYSQRPRQVRAKIDDRL